MANEKESKEPGTIILPVPIQVPSVTFDILSPTDIRFSVARDKSGKILDIDIQVILTPYSSQSGDDLPLKKEYLTIKKIKSKIASDPLSSVAVAYTALMKAISDEYAAQHVALKIDNKMIKEK